MMEIEGVMCTWITKAHQDSGHLLLQAPIVCHSAIKKVYFDFVEYFRKHLVLDSMKI